MRRVAQAGGRLCRANGAVSLALAWGNAPGFHGRKKKALKARLIFVFRFVVVPLRD
jgi:hypothetical protein